MSEGLNRDELFDKHNFDEEMVESFSDSQEEKEMRSLTRAINYSNFNRSF